MAAILIYIIKSSGCLILFYLLYKLLMSKETFHHLNRFILISMYFFALLIPSFEFKTSVNSDIHQFLLNCEHLITSTRTTETIDDNMVSAGFPWGRLLISIYSLGGAFFAIRFIYSYIRLFLLLRTTCRISHENGYILVTHDRKIAPFSFWNYLVISRKDIDENSDIIIAHECAHLRNFHTLDLFISGFFNIIFWFNPASWLIKYELQNVHEFEADEFVLKTGINAKTYQLLLIKKAVGTKFFSSVTNNFNHSKLKKRITMMLSKKSNPWARLKCLYLAPITAFAVFACSSPQVSEPLKEFKGELSYRTDTATTIRNGEKVNIPIQILEKNDIQEVNCPLFIYDGKEISLEEVGSIDINNIESITILKDTTSVRVYGVKGKYGAVIMEVKFLPNRF